MELEDIKLNEICQTQKDKFHVFSHTYGNLKKKKDDLKVERDCQGRRRGRRGVATTKAQCRQCRHPGETC